MQLHEAGGEWAHARTRGMRAVWRARDLEGHEIWLEPLLPDSCIAVGVGRVVLLVLADPAARHPRHPKVRARVEEEVVAPWRRDAGSG